MELNYRKWFYCKKKFKNKTNKIKIYFFCNLTRWYYILNNNNNKKKIQFSFFFKSHNKALKNQISKMYSDDIEYSTTSKEVIF